MSEHDEAVKLLRDIVDTFDAPHIAYVRPSAKCIGNARAFLARQDEDADVAAVREFVAGVVLSDAQVPHGPIGGAVVRMGHDKCLAALDRIAARLRDAPKYGETKPITTDYEAGRRDERAMAVNELRRRVGCMANPAFDREHAVLLNAVEFIERGDHVTVRRSTP